MNQGRSRTTSRTGSSASIDSKEGNQLDLGIGRLRSSSVIRDREIDHNGGEKRPIHTSSPMNDALTSALDSTQSSAISKDLLDQITSQITASVLQQLNLSQSTNKSEHSIQRPSSPGRLRYSPRSVSPVDRVAYTPPSPIVWSGKASHSSNFPETFSQSSYSNEHGADVGAFTRDETTILEKVWGQLFDEKGNPTARLGQFLQGIAIYIIENFDPKNSIVITPGKMQNFYQATRLQHEVYPWQNVFDDRTSSISRALRELKVQHHLVQDDVGKRPDIPGFTPHGFATWMTLVIQAHPDLEFLRLSKIVFDLPINNPDDRSERFPKEISRRLLPTNSDDSAAVKIEKALFLHCGVKPQGSRTWRIDSDQEIASSSSSMFEEALTSPVERERKPYVAGPEQRSLFYTMTEKPEISYIDLLGGTTILSRFSRGKRSKKTPYTLKAPSASYGQSGENSNKNEEDIPREDNAGSNLGIAREQVQPHESEALIASVEPADKVESEQSSPLEGSRQRVSQGEPQCVAWTCSCGTKLVDYYTEMVPGSLEQLRGWLRDQFSQQSRGSQSDSLTLGIATVAPTTGHSEQDLQTPRDNLRSQALPGTVGTAGPNAIAKSLRVHNDSVSTSMQSSVTLSTSPLSTVVSYLLLCIPEGLAGLKLQHLQILRQIASSSNNTSNLITNDKQLFRLLREKYRSERKLFISRFWPKTVIRVSMAYFLVDLSAYVELKHYGCLGKQPDDCKCIPPKDLIQPAPDAQYHCVPREPPFKPPIGTNYLTHYFQNHDCIMSDKAVFVLNQLPKRVGQCIVTSGVDRVEGWGLEFEEGWDPGRLRKVGFIITFIGTLIFGFVWAILKRDPQTAFTISAFFVGLFTMVGGYTASAEPRVVHR